MARKLTDEEREKINELTGVLCKALPAAQRNFGAGIASALVRIPRPQITMRDLGRICGKYGEDKAMLIELVKTEVLDAVEGQEGPAAWTLRSFGTVVAPEESLAGEKDTEVVTAEAELVVEAEVPVETAGVAPEKPASTRRRRRGGVSVEAEPEVAAEAAETVPEPLAEKPRPGRGSRRRAAAAAASEAATEEADLEPTAPEPAASESTEAPASAPSSKPRSRRRRRSAEPAETNADAVSSDAPASPDASEPAEVPTEKPRSRRRRRSAAKPEVSESAPSTAKESASEDAQVTPSAEPAVPVDPQPAAAPEPAPEPPAPATPEPPAAPELSPEPDDAPAPTRRGRLRRRSSRPGRREEAKQPQGLAEVPYVRRGGETEAQIREKIVALDQRFWMNGWLLSHPGAYTLYEREITSLNDALKDGTLHGDITRRQLAYQMGGDEKFFEFGSDGLKLLRAMGVEDLIRHRPMPKPDLLYHAPRRRKHMRVLVTENLDPWLDVRDLMYEDGRSLILGERIHAVVLGGGTPVLEHNRLALLLDTLGADDLEVLYWGDIDRAGLEIYAKLRDMLTPTYTIKPFTVAYQIMADRAAERFPDPLENETTGQVNIELADPALICEGLTPEAAAYSRAVLENCRLVPQEILTKRDL